MRKLIYRETAGQDPAASEPILEFPRIWQALPKVVFSRSLEAVEGNTRFFPELEDQIDLDLVQTQTFSSRVVYLRYRLAG